MSADPLPNCGGKAWQGDSEDEKSTSNQKKLSHKKSNVKKTNERHNSNSDDLGQIKKSNFKFQSSDEDASIFNTICGNDFKKKVAKNVKMSMKTDTVDIFITGPFHNAKTGKSSWIIVCGDYRSAWTLKWQFIKGYIGTLLTKIKKTTISIDHSGFYDIIIRKYEFGTESVWRRKKQSKTEDIDKGEVFGMLTILVLLSSWCTR